MSSKSVRGESWTHSGNFRALHPPGAEFDARSCAAFWEIIEAQTVETSTVYAGASVLAGGGVAVSMLGARA